MKIHATNILDCYLIEPSLFVDERGTFQETFSQRQFEELTGQQVHFVQDNQSESTRGVLRGLHYQKGDMAQAKLVRVAQGRVLDIVVDLRPDSPSFGQSFSAELSNENRLQLYAPRGLAHGFVTLSDRSVFVYKCDNYYDQKSESGIIFNDATLALDWHLPREELIISAKDLELPSFQDAIQ